MNCQVCQSFYDADNQSPVCPHERLDPPLNRLGGPRLRVEIQREIDEAFHLKDIYTLTGWLGSANFAARFYAQDRINRLREPAEGNGVVELEPPGE